MSEGSDDWMASAGQEDRIEQPFTGPVRPPSQLKCPSARQPSSHRQGLDPQGPVVARAAPPLGRGGGAGCCRGPRKVFVPRVCADPPAPLPHPAPL